MQRQLRAIAWVLCFKCGNRSSACRSNQLPGNGSGLLQEVGVEVWETKKISLCCKQQNSLKYTGNIQILKRLYIIKTILKENNTLHHTTMLWNYLQNHMKRTNSQKKMDFRLVPGGKSTSIIRKPSQTLAKVQLTFLFCNIFWRRIYYLVEWLEKNGGPM